MPSTAIRAYCFASGRIEFGKRVPKGAIPFARGEELALREYLEPLARHGYRTELVNGRPTKIPGTETLLVPGIPEASDQHAALDALHSWLQWVGTNPPAGITMLA
jgi:hypothetical protein